MSRNPVGWFEIYVQDMPKAKAFYEGVFSVELTKLESPELEMWGFPSNMETHGTSGSLVHVPGYPSGGNSTLVYFSCADCAVEEAKVEQYGGTIHRPKMSIGEYGFITLAEDPDGNMIGLHSIK